MTFYNLTREHSALQYLVHLLMVVVYKPVSRIIAGGFSSGRPAEVAVLGVDLIWDNGDYIVWDNDDNIAWEA